MHIDEASQPPWIRHTMKLPGLVDLSLILILVSHSNGQEWNITVQKTINAVSGTDVIILCNFTYPQTLLVEDVKVYWKKFGGKKMDIKDKDQNPFVYHTNSTFVLEEYRGKTELIGDQSKGDCTLKIKNIKNNEPGIYVRISAKADNYSFYQKRVSISVSGAVPVTSTPGIDPFSGTFETTTICTNTVTSGDISAVYPAVFVPVAALLILVFAAGFVFYRKHKRSLVREDSGYYANFSRTTSNQVNREACQKKDNKTFPEPKVIDEPVYINVEAPRDQMAQIMDHTDNIYANVDYTK